MKLISFNINSIRARLHQLSELIISHLPDIIGLQETKVTDDEFPVDAVRELGYESCFYGQKGHYGVAVLYRTDRLDLLSEQRGFPSVVCTETGEEQRRLLICSFKTTSNQTLNVCNGYFPQGESRDHPVKFPNKAAFYRKTHDFITKSYSTTDKVVVMGDMNIAPQDVDIGIGEDNRKRWLRSGKCCFLPEERQWFNAILNLGYTDTFRYLNQDISDCFSWFDYRSKGFEREPKRGLRIDHILVSNNILEHCLAAGIDYGIRAMAKPSDHCPVWLELNL